MSVIPSTPNQVSNTGQKTGLSEDKLPFAPEAERSVIGTILMDPAVFLGIREVLNATDFYRESHRTIYQAMEDVSDAGNTPDYTTVLEHLRGTKQLDMVGGQTYVSGLLDASAPSSMVQNYAMIVHDRSQSRSLVRIAQEVVQAGLAGTFENAGEYSNFAESRLLETLRSTGRGTLLDMKQVLNETVEQVKTLCTTTSTLTGVSTGFRDLDAKTLGLQGGELIIIAARPGMGKSALALNIAANAALQGECPVLLFSLEMSPEQLGMRLIAQEGRVPLQRIRSGTLQAKDWEDVHTAMSALMKARIYLDATPALSVVDISGRARRLALENKCGMVIVDYLQLVNSRPGIYSREQAVADVSRSLKQLAMELNIPVIALSQLNRSVESRKPPRPMLSDLRESGAIEQDADVIMFIYRDEYYQKEESDQQGLAEVEIAKQRSGPTGRIIVRFTPEVTRFDNVDTGFSPGDVNVNIGGVPDTALPPPPEPIGGDDDDFSGMV